MTPLHIAVKYGYPDVAEFLLEKGAKVNKANIVFFFINLMMEFINDFFKSNCSSHCS